MFNIQVEEVRVVKLYQSEIMKHIWSVFVLLLQDKFQLVQELDFDPIIVLYIGNVSDILRL